MKKEEERTEEQLIEDICDVFEGNIKKTMNLMGTSGEVQPLMEAITLVLKERWIGEEKEESKILTLGDI